MLSRTLILIFSSVILLATSFCVHKQQNSRDVSSGSDVTAFEGPQIIDAEVGELHIYFKVHEHPIRTTTLVVKYLCEPKGEPEVLMDTMIAHFEGASIAYTWSELAELTGLPVADLVRSSDLHDKKSVVILKYYEIQVQDFLSKDKEAPPAEMKQSKLDLTLWCKGK